MVPPAAFANAETSLLISSLRTSVFSSEGHALYSSSRLSFASVSISCWRSSSVHSHESFMGAIEPLRRRSAQALNVPTAAHRIVDDVASRSVRQLHQPRERRHAMD